jgi:hypothetical protein
MAFINILSVIDTDAITSTYNPDHHDKKNPQKADLDTERMICSGSHGVISGQGTANLSFKAKRGDEISFRGISVSDNSGDSVIIYNIECVEGDNIFLPFTVDVKTITGAVVPNDNTPNGIPPLHEEMSFSSFNSKIIKHGTTTLAIQFGLYKLNDTGEKQQLYGYFEWDAILTIS